MPRFRRARRSRFRRRRRPRRRRRRSRLTRSMPDPELKDFTQQVDIDNAFQTGTITLLNGISQGVGVSQRIGRRALFQSVLLRWCIKINDANTNPHCYRIAIVLDRFPQGIFPPIDQIWTSMNTAFAPVGVRTLSNTNKFKVLWQRLIPLDLAHQVNRGSKFLRLRFSTLYGGTGPAIADMSTNALHLILTSDATGVGGNEPPLFQGLFRTRYTG